MPSSLGIDARWELKFGNWKECSKRVFASYKDFAVTEAL